MRPDGVDLSEHFTLTYADDRYARGAASMVEFLLQRLDLPRGGSDHDRSRLLGYLETHPCAALSAGEREHRDALGAQRLRADVARGDGGHPRRSYRVHPNAVAAAAFDAMDESRRRLYRRLS